MERKEIWILTYCLEGDSVETGFDTFIGKSKQDAKDKFYEEMTETIARLGLTVLSSYIGTPDNEFEVYTDQNNEKQLSINIKNMTKDYDPSLIM